MAWRGYRAAVSRESGEVRLRKQELTEHYHFGKRRSSKSSFFIQPFNQDVRQPIHETARRRDSVTMTDSTPFRGRITHVNAPMRVLHRFTKPGGHWAEIRERKVTTFRAIEYIVYVDGSLLESEMFHHGREAQ